MMTNEKTEKHIEEQLKHYFKSAQAHKCPSSMKKNLYQQIAKEKASSWSFPRLVTAGVSLALVVSVSFKFINHQSQQQEQLLQAQQDMQVAMHYMNRVSFKSLTSFNNNGLKPGLIKPLAKSVATL